MEKTIINFELPKSLKRKAIRDAKKNDLDLSKWLRKLIKESK